MKKQLLLLVCLLSISISQSQTFDDGILEYTVTDIEEGYVSVNKYDGVCPTRVLTIPSEVTDPYSDVVYYVTSIEEDAFNSCYDLTSINIPSGVTSIGAFAFKECEGLTSVTLPSSVTSIGDEAFNSCYRLTDITLPSSLISIGKYTFSYCKKLTSVNLPSGITSIGEGAFGDCSDLVNVSFPSSVISIGDDAFKNCYVLENVILPSNLISIGDYAFSDCYYVTSINIPSSVTSIGEGAFYACLGLTSVSFSFPSGVTTIEDKAFYGSKLKSISLPSGVTRIGEGAFEGCSNLTSLMMPSSITSIGGNAFGNCTGLTSVAVDWVTPLAINTSVFDGVTIGEIPLKVPLGTGSDYGSASVWKDFNVNKNQTFVVGGLEYAVTDIANNYVSVKKDSVTCPTGNLIIPATVTYLGTTYSVTTIDASAFKDCTGLASVSIPSSITSIKDHAFRDCTGLTSVTVDWETPLVINAAVFSGVTISAIPLRAPLGTGSDYGSASVWKDFNVNKNQTFVAGGLGYTVIDTENNYVSVKKDGVTSPTGDLIIPATVTYSETTYSVTAIGASAFKDCTGLTSVDIPSSIISVGASAFRDCTGLTSVTVNRATPLEILKKHKIFNKVPINTISLTVPAGAVSAYQNAEVWQDFASIIVLDVDGFAVNDITEQANPNLVNDQLDAAVSSGIVLDVDGFVVSDTTEQADPNLVQNQLDETVNLDLLIEEVTIYDNLGELIPKGVYFVEILTNKGVTTKKVVVE
ncbi:MAG: leucine-rich repeat protein [Flavobacteriaceae bacterium]|nr:leucine-rich repeat protein [Flavobacteriaceae bacterium]